MPAPDPAPGWCALARVSPWLVAAWLCLGPIAVPGTASGSAVEPDAELIELGRQIYEEGIGSSEMTAVLAGGLEVEGTVLVCAGCHGAGGEGRPEGGLTPSDLRPTMLRRPYEVRSASGRVHGPYDDRSLVRAIAMGVDPAGNALQASMPRYRTSRRDMKALVAYLGQLESRRRAGVDAEAMRIGVLVPASESADPSAGGSEAARSATWIDAYFSRYLDPTGIFGRRLEAVTIAYEPGVPAARGEAVRALEEADLLAVLGGGLELDRAWIEAAEQLGLPWIGPRSLDGPAGAGPAAGGGLPKTTFYLEAGLEEQVRVLAEHAARTWPGLRSRVVAQTDPGPLVAAAEAAWFASAEALEQPEPRALGVGRGTAPAVALAGGAPTEPAPILLLVPGEAGRRILEGWARQNSAPGAAALPLPVLAPGPVVASWFEVGEAGSTIPPWHSSRLELYVTTQGLGSGAGRRADGTDPRRAAGPFVERWSQVARERALPPLSASSARHLLASLQVLEESLQRVGADLGRASLVRALESLRNLETGVAPPISFGPNRRVGFDRPRVSRLGGPESRAVAPAAGQ